VYLYVSGQRVPRNFRKFLSVPWVRKGCGALA